MFGSKSRRLAELEARIEHRDRELDKARGTTATPADTEAGPDWERIAKQLAEDRVDASRADAEEMARLNDIAQGWEKLAAKHQRRADVYQRRADRLAPAVVRCWAEIGRLRRQLAERDVSVLTRQLRDANERIANLDEQLAVLQTANEQHYRDLQARPARIPRQQHKAA